MNLRFIKRVLLVTLFIPAIALANEVDLALEVTSPQEEQTISTIVPFYFQITNNSENTATNVVFENDFSSYRTRYETNGGNPYNVPDLSLVSVGSTVGNCELQESIVICHIDSISGKTKAHIDIEMQVEYVGDLKMHAKAFSSQIDNNESNNAQEIIINVSKHNVDEYAELISYNFSNQEFVRGASASPQVSANGRLISFSSEGHLISEISEFKNIFTYDRETQQFHISNVSNSGQYSNNTNSSVRTSSDGNNLVFHSLASNLVNGDNNQIGDLFCHMRSTEETLRISVSNDGVEANSPPQSWDISPDGNYIVFVSKASNLVEGDNNGDDDIFIFDMRSRTISRLDFSHADFTMTSWVSEVRVSDNGKYIAFAAWPNKDFSNYVHNLYIWEKETGITKKINILKMPNGSDFTSASMINFSDNGKYVVYTGGNRWERQYHVYKYSIEADETKLISYAIGKQIENNDSLFPSISGDGRFVAFRSSSSNLVKDDINNADDIFVHDAESDTIKMVSIGVGGFQAKGGSNTVDISSDGSTIAFTSDAHNLSLINSDDNRDVTNIYAAKNPFLTEIIKEIDLSISKSTSTSSIEIGSNITYTLSIDNISADTKATATEVSVTDALPAGLTFVSATPSTGTCSEDAGTVSCNLGGIAVGDATATVEIVATATSTGEIVNTASVSANETDLDISNNSSEATITVIETTDISISGPTSPVKIGVGDELKLDYVVSNNSANSAPNVTATFNIPEQIAVSSAVIDGGMCSVATSVVTCIVDEVADDAVNISITTIPSVPGDYDISSSVSTTKTDSNLDNNDNSLNVNVVPVLSIATSDVPDPVLAGDSITFIVEITNNSVTAMDSAQLVHTRPNQFKHQSMTSSQGACVRNRKVVTCDLGTIDGLATATFELTLQAKSGATVGTYDNEFNFSATHKSTPITRDVIEQTAIVRNAEVTAVIKGAGKGTVAAASGIINCPGDCNEKNMVTGDTLTLTATPDATSVFQKWTGVCKHAGTEDTCTITLKSGNNRAVANFIKQPKLTVKHRGAGKGSVSSDTTISCPGVCDEYLASGTEVTLIATPDDGSSFDRWTGTCKSAGKNPVCTITITKNVNAVANFIVNPTLTASIKGNGSVSSSDGYIACPGDCKENYPVGDTVTLTATADSGYMFDKWTGACKKAGKSDTCKVTVTKATKAVANFIPLPTVKTVINGNGTITTNDGGIACPGDCEQHYEVGTTITFTATPDLGAVFDRWTGACKGKSTECTLNLNNTQNKTVRAVFK